MDTPNLSFEELATLAGLPGRTVRYYIQRGLVDRPIGAGRGAHYSGKHLEQLLMVRKWTDAGVSLERILDIASSPDQPPPRRSRQGEISVRSHIALVPGIELVIAPEESGLTPNQVRCLTQRILEVCRDVAADPDHSQGEDI